MNTAEGNLDASLGLRYGERVVTDDKGKARVVREVAKRATLPADFENVADNDDK